MGIQYTTLELWIFADPSPVSPVLRKEWRKISPACFFREPAFAGGKTRQKRSGAVSGFDSDNAGRPVCAERPGLQAEQSHDPTRRMLAAIVRAQRLAIDTAEPGEIFTGMLSDIVELSGSTFGFMGEVAYTPEDRPFLRTQALTDIAWNEETRALYHLHREKGLEFHKLDTLFGAVLKSGRPVIANDPPLDPRSGGLPAGHPPLASFLGLPVCRGHELVGAVGLANRPGGYGEELVDFLQPLLATYAMLIVALRAEALRRTSAAQLSERERQLRLALGEAEEARARADAILGAIGEPLTIQDRDFRVIYQNEANRRIMGDCRGRSCFEAYEGNSEICEGCALEQAFADGRMHTSERRVEKNGEVLYFELTATPLLDKSGRAVAGIEIARNITEQKRRERQLVEQVRLLSLSAAVGSVLTKADTVQEMLGQCAELLVIHLGAAFARIWTVTRDGAMLELRASAGLYTHTDGEHSRIPVGQFKIGVIARDRKPHITNEVIGDPLVHDQEWAKREKMVAFAGHPLLIEDRLVGVVGMFFRQPLSYHAAGAIASVADEIALGIDRLRAEESLARSNRALRILSRCSEVLVHARSEAGLLRQVCDLIVEPEGYRMAWVGYAEKGGEQMVRPVAWAGFTEGYLESIRVRWDGSPEGGGPTGTAIRTGQTSLVKDTRIDPAFMPWHEEAGARGYLSVLGLPLLDGAQQAFGALTIYSPEADAFDEEEVGLLRELAADLSFGIRTLRLRQEYDREQREKDSLQARLRQSQKLEAIGTLAGGIAHDFNNILSSVLGFAELAKEEMQAYGKASGDIEQVILAGKRAVDLVRQILTLSRQTEQEKKPVRIQLIVKEALKLLRPSISSHIEIRSDIDMNCPPVLADATEIHQVIMNLCTNAYQAMREGGGFMEIGLAQLKPDEGMELASATGLKPGSYLRLTVRDSGCGMDAATREKIFEPYFTTKKKGEGTGLGLAVVYGIVTNCGGTILVESEPGRGSRFDVFLPTCETDGAAQEGQAAASLLTGSERLLVVDDEATIAEMMRRILSGLGYQVEVFTDPAEALARFAAEPGAFDLVITDMNMPKLLGTDLVAAMLGIRPELPVILCTGFSEKIDLEEARAIGIRELLFKPVGRDTFARQIRKVLDGEGEGG